jgi:hypothetical protein
MELISTLGIQVLSGIGSENQKTRRMLYLIVPVASYVSKVSCDSVVVADVEREKQCVKLWNSGYRMYLRI